MAVEAHDEFACVAIDSVDITDVAVVDVLVVVILDLHDLVTGGEGPAEPLDFPVVGGIESGLQFDVERSGADTAAVHRAENLDVADGVEAEPPRDPGLDQLDDTLHRDLGLFDRHEVEIAFGSWRSEIGNSSLIIRCALVMMRLCAAWRNTSVRRIIVRAPDVMTSDSTCAEP